MPEVGFAIKSLQKRIEDQDDPENRRKGLEYYIGRAFIEILHHYFANEIVEGVEELTADRDDTDRTLALEVALDGQILLDSFTSGIVLGELEFTRSEVLAFIEPLLKDWLQLLPGALMIDPTRRSREKLVWEDDEEMGTLLVLRLEEQ